MKDYRNQFPFRIGTTSYIIPQADDNLIANVSYLMNHFDKIQLLFFGKDYLNEVASPDILLKLLQLKSESQISYSIHLPIDLYLLDCGMSQLEKSIDIIEHIMTISDRLCIDEYILHIDRKGSSRQKIDIKLEEFENVLNRLSVRLGQETSKIYLENTNNDLVQFKDIIANSMHPVCMDVGHLHLLSLRLSDFISAFENRIKEIHLHGCAGNNDHLSLMNSEVSYLKPIMNYLRVYNQSVIVEVFNEEDLKGSMEYLENYFIGLTG